MFRMQITLNVTSNVNTSLLVGKEFYVDELSLEDADILHLCEIPNPTGMQTCLCLCRIRCFFLIGGHGCSLFYQKMTYF